MAKRLKGLKVVQTAVDKKIKKARLELDGSVECTLYGFVYDNRITNVKRLNNKSIGYRYRNNKEK